VILQRKVVDSSSGQTPASEDAHDVFEKALWKTRSHKRVRWGTPIRSRERIRPGTKPTVTYEKEMLGP